MNAQELAKPNPAQIVLRQAVSLSLDADTGTDIGKQGRADLHR